MSNSINVVEGKDPEFLISKNRLSKETGEGMQDIDLENLRLLGSGFIETIVDGTVNLSALAGLLNTLTDDPTKGIKLLREIPDTEGSQVLLVEMSTEIANQFKEAYKGHVLVSENSDLELFQIGEPPEDQDFTLESEWNSGLVPFDQPFKATIVVRGSDNVAIENATVYILGSLWVAKEVTDAQGRAELELYGETRETLRALFVKPEAEYWNYWLDKPVLDQNADENEVKLIPLGDHETLTGFPEKEIVGWGQEEMQLSTTADSPTGEGIKIAVIDSGLDTFHADLAHSVVHGVDYTHEPPSNDTWKQDVVGHGSHVTGVIAGLRGEAGANKSGIRGFAPKADLYIFKVFPGGKIEHLIKSMKWCIANKIDIVNLSLGSKVDNPELHQTFIDAKNAGVASIAAAGNSGGSVLYPAKWQEVMAVAAIGKNGTFPDSTRHEQLRSEHQADDIFSAKFTCFGPEIDVVAPGVAIASAVPRGRRGYAAWDGTSMACPHVVGLAALCLETHPNIRNAAGTTRVDSLFTAIKSKAEKLNNIPDEFQGAGLPKLGDVVVKPENGTLTKLANLLQDALDCIKQAQV